MSPTLSARLGPAPARGAHPNRRRPGEEHPAITIGGRVQQGVGGAAQSRRLALVSHNMGKRRCGAESGHRAQLPAVAGPVVQDLPADEKGGGVLRGRVWFYGEPGRRGRARPRPGRPGERLWSRHGNALRRREIAKRRLAVDEVLHWLPRVARRIFADPTHEALRAPPTRSEAEDLLHLVLRQPVRLDHNGCRHHGLPAHPVGPAVEAP